MIPEVQTFNNDTNCLVKYEHLRTQIVNTFADIHKIFTHSRNKRGAQVLSGIIAFVAGSITGYVGNNVVTQIKIQQLKDLYQTTIQQLEKLTIAHNTLINNMKDIDYKFHNITKVINTNFQNIKLDANRRTWELLITDSIAQIKHLSLVFNDIIYKSYKGEVLSFALSEQELVGLGNLNNLSLNTNI